MRNQDDLMREVDGGSLLDEFGWDSSVHSSFVSGLLSGLFIVLVVAIMFQLDAMSFAELVAAGKFVYGMVALTVGADMGYESYYAYTVEQDKQSAGFYLVLMAILLMIGGRVVHGYLFGG